MSDAAAPLPADACYLALKARDARFDGRFFTGVTSTGIYCRPVCKVRTPRRENCRFFAHAAQAERAGFRPCLRCRPELAPSSLAWSIQDASRTLALQAARLLDEPQAWGEAGAPVQQLAQRLGVSERHLRRIFETHLGVSPHQYLQTRRLLTAKQLLADTELPITRIAWISGFASVRRFNAAFVLHYGLNPSQLRRDGARPGAGGAAIRLGLRPPYDAPAMLERLRQRAVPGMEWVSTAGCGLAMARTLALRVRGQWCRGWLMAEFDPPRHQVLLQVSPALREVLPQVMHRLRAALGLDADPLAVKGKGRMPQRGAPGAGHAVPGAMDDFESAARSVLGQRLTVAAARALTQRLVERFGEPITTSSPALTRLFPEPAVLAHASADALAQLGIVAQRQAAIVALAQAAVVATGPASTPHRENA